MPDLLPELPIGPSSIISPMSTGSRAKWWFEPELALLIVFVLGAYFTRMSDLTIRGEESRRGLIAREMLTTGDWIVPRCQGVTLFSRPPLQNWLIAGLAVWRGEIDAVSLRLPSDIALLLTVVMIYGYARRFQSRLGACTSALAYASMGQVLELGRMGETDALFTFFVSGSLIVWHWSFQKYGSTVGTWCLGYLFVGLGMLTKGPQAPVYFAGVIGAYLLWTGHWRAAFSKAHLAGIALFCLIFGAWQIPFVRMLGPEGAGRMYVNDVGHRFMDMTIFSFGEHLFNFPFEVFACMLPWSGLLVAWSIPRVRRLIGEARPNFIFLTLCLAVTFPTVWLPPGARPRYFMPLYPCAALMAGLAADRLWQATGDVTLQGVWKVFVCACSVAMGAAGLGILVISLGNVRIWLAQPAAGAWTYAVLCLLLATVAWRSLRTELPRARRIAILAIAGFLALTHCTVGISALQRDSVDTSGEVAELKAKLPPGTKLVSFEQVHHMFVFYFNDDVPVLPAPKSADDADEISYFCIAPGELQKSPLPFEWEKLAEINCDRRIEPTPRARVVIGRRLARPATATVQQAAGEDAETARIQKTSGYR
jgi:4-amino-4-deoxy-L-arabinose transferase-like glycosyltransferase